MAGSPQATSWAYRCAVPDKRRESKNRRAARNKTQRGSLAARRENAAVQAPTRPPAKGRATTGGRASSAAAAAATPAPPAPPPRGGLLGLARSRRPGDRAVLAALVLAVVVTVVMLFLPIVRIDDRGEPVPRRFGGVALLARETLTGHHIPKESTNLLAANGPQILLVLLLPVAVAGFAVWANRRPDRSRLLTYSMIVMAGFVLLGFPYFLPPLIALFIAGFQVRRADAPARLAERATRTPARGRRRGEVIDVESTETDADEGADDADDPLAELDAEIEAERAAEAATAGTGSDTDTDADADAGTGTGAAGRGNGSGTRKRRR